MAIRYIKDMDYEEVVALLHEDDDFRRKIEDHVIDFVGDDIIYHLEKAPRCIDWEVDRGFQRVWVHPRNGIGDCCDNDTLNWLKQINYEAGCFCEDDMEKLDHLWDLRKKLDSPEFEYRWNEHDEVSGKMEDELEEGVEYLLDTLSDMFSDELLEATDVEHMADFVMANDHIYGDMAFGEEDEEEDESPSGKVWDVVTLDAEEMKANELNFKTFCEWYEYIEERLYYLRHHNKNYTKKQEYAIEEINSAFGCFTNC